MRVIDRITSKDGFIDLHSHTDYSFGHEMGKMRLSPLQYLEELRQYTEKYNKPVTFALTDHNNINGNRKILQEINANPDKYKNIRFIPGCEYTVSTDSLGHCYKDGKEYPLVKDNRIHMLAYGMNLDDPDIKYLNECMSTSKKRVREYITEFKPVKFGNIVFTTKAWLKARNIEVSLTEFRKNCPIQDSFDETFAVVEKFIKEKYKLSEKDMKDWRNYTSNTDNLISHTKADIQEVMSIVENAGGYTVLAHPVYDGPSDELQNLDLSDSRNKKYKDISFDDVSYKKMPEEEKQHNLRKMENYYDFLYRSLSVKAQDPITGKKLNGIVGHELMHSANQKNFYKFDTIMKTGDKYGLYCTGGSDTHGSLYYYVIPSRVVGSQVQKYTTKLDSTMSAYAMVKCDFADDFFKAQKNGTRLEREVGRTARKQIELLKTVGNTKTHYDMNQFREIVIDSYTKKKKDDMRLAQKIGNKRLMLVRNDFVDDDENAFAYMD